MLPDISAKHVAKHNAPRKTKTITVLLGGVHRVGADATTRFRGVLEFCQQLPNRRLLQPAPAAKKVRFLQLYLHSCKKPSRRNVLHRPHVHILQ